MMASTKRARPLMTMATLLIGSSMALSGCQATKSWLGKRDDGSLAYQDSQKLAPLTLPADQQAAPFVPLYPTPDLGTNTLTLTNASGKQFKLSPPEVSQAAIIGEP